MSGLVDREWWHVMIWLDKEEPMDPTRNKLMNKITYWHRPSSNSYPVKLALITLVSLRASQRDLSRCLSGENTKEQRSSRDIYTRISRKKALEFYTLDLKNQSWVLEKSVTLSSTSLSFLSKLSAMKVRNLLLLLHLSREGSLDFS